VNIIGMEDIAKIRQILEIPMHVQILFDNIDEEDPEVLAAADMLHKLNDEQHSWIYLSRIVYKKHELDMVRLNMNTNYEMTPVFQKKTKHDELSCIMCSTCDLIQVVRMGRWYMFPNPTHLRLTPFTVLDEDLHTSVEGPVQKIDTGWELHLDF